MTINQSIPNQLDHPAVWRGEELFEREDWIYELSEGEKDSVRNSLNVHGSAELPESVNQRLKQIQNSLENGSGVSMIRGVPVDAFTVDQLESLFLSAGQKVGTPISQSAAGEKIFSVRNAGFADDDPRARGPNTKKKLSFHTDRCDVIGFLCLKQAKSGGENQVVSSMTLFNEIQRQRPDLMEVLMRPFLYKRHTVDTANQKPYTEQPIFSFFQGHFAANFLRVLIDRAYASNDTPELTSIQKEALDFVEEQAARTDLHVTFSQRPGDMLFLNNWVTLHRRTAFEDFHEPQKRRHLFRAWLSMPNSRPIDPMFAGNYGATGAGEIRGGMKASQNAT